MLKSLPRPSATIPIRHDDVAIVDEENAEYAEYAEYAEPPRRAVTRHPVPVRGLHRAAANDQRYPVHVPRTRSAGESIARLLYFVSGALLAAAVLRFGLPIWQDARHAPPSAAVPATHSAAAVAIAAGGRVELAIDRRAVARLAGDAPRWTAPLPTAIDAIEITGPVVLGRAPDAIVALDLESGRTRFSWALPTDERWGAQRPAALGTCLVTVTSRGGKAIVRCLDLATGSVRWTAAPAGAHDCTAPPEAVPGAYLLPCPGWTAVIDDRSGAVAVEAGGVGLVQADPPYLLRARSHLTISPWSPTKRRFTATGEIAYGAGGAAASSAVLYKDRLVLRAIESSDELATVLPRNAGPIAVAAPVYRLADATPLVRDCGGTAPPRFQLLGLAPRIGASFDPATVQDRALALLDVETGTLAWTSRKLAGLRTQTAPGPPPCRGGHYLVPLELPGSAGQPASLLWVVDAATGKTTAVLAFDAELDASFARLTADQIDADRIVGIGRGGPFELSWQAPGHGLHDARRELEAALGPLP